MKYVACFIIWPCVISCLNPFTAKGEFDETKKILNPELSNET